MSLVWIVRCQNLIILLILQIIVSLCLIYNGKNKASHVSELLIMIGFALYGGFSFEIKLIVCYLFEYVLMKVLIIFIIFLLKLFSFYVLTCVTHKRKKGYNFWVKKKKLLRFFARFWSKVDYGIRVKKGYPYMVNKKHLKTGVLFDKDGFPKFKVIATIKLEKKLWKKTREVHFYNASRKLYAKITKSSVMEKKFTKKEIASFRDGKVPSKYTWHHHQDKGVLQLVEYKIHSEVRHRGGYAIWGKRN